MLPPCFLCGRRPTEEETKGGVNTIPPPSPAVLPVHTQPMLIKIGSPLGAAWSVVLPPLALVKYETGRRSSPWENSGDG